MSSVKRIARWGERRGSDACLSSSTNRRIRKLLESCAKRASNPRGTAHEPRGANMHFGTGYVQDFSGGRYVKQPRKRLGCLLESFVSKIADSAARNRYGFSYTTLPPTTVSMMWASLMVSGGIRVRSWSIRT